MGIGNWLITDKNATCLVCAGEYIISYKTLTEVDHEHDFNL